MKFGPNDGWTGVWFKLGGELVLVDSSKKGKILHRRVDYLFLTHSHLDHCYFAGLEPGYEVYASEFSCDFLCNRLVRRRIHRVPSDDAFFEVDQGGRVSLDNFELESVLTCHSCPESYAWVVESDDVRVLVTGDWYSPPGTEVIERLAGVEPDILVTESTRSTTYSPDTPMANLGRMEWVYSQGYENVLLLANWQHTDLVRQFSKVFGRPYVWEDDPIRVSCELDGVSFNLLGMGDDLKYPIVTSMDARIPRDTDCIIFEFGHQPKVTSEIDRVKVSLGGHACRSEVKRLIDLSKPKLVVLHHGSNVAMKSTARWIEKSTKVDAVYWPSTSNPAVLTIDTSDYV